MGPRNKARRRAVAPARLCSAACAPAGLHGRHFGLGPEDAALMTNRYLKPRFVIPMHYGTYPILSGKPEEYIKALGKSSTRVIVPQPGEKVDF
jgi:L-ascorbate metabolism protein UlaG (beta-lactamase superfamily)